MKKRTAVSRRTRFEVFKRDSFKCQYCGKAAPDVILHCDHVKPVAGGGDSDLTNLVTACAGCNMGKGKIPLSDRSAAEKSRAGLEELQVKKEQIEMVAEWAAGLRDLDGLAVSKADAAIQVIRQDYATSDHGKKLLSRWIKRFGLDEVLAAIGISFDQYADWDEAFMKVEGICKCNRRRKEDPLYDDANHVGNVARKFHHFNWGVGPTLIRDALEKGIPKGVLMSVICESSSWTMWTGIVEEMISDG